VPFSRDSLSPLSYTARMNPRPVLLIDGRYTPYASFEFDPLPTFTEIGSDRRDCFVSARTFSVDGGPRRNFLHATLTQRRNGRLALAIVTQ